MKFFDLEDEFYREFPYRIQVILTGDLNYSDPNTQYEIEKLMEAFENTSYVTSSLYTESWLRAFLEFLDRNQEFLNITINSEQDFIDAMKTVNMSTPSSCVYLLLIENYRNYRTGSSLGFRIRWT